MTKAMNEFLTNFRKDPEKAYVIFGQRYNEFTEAEIRILVQQLITAISVDTPKEKRATSYNATATTINIIITNQDELREKYYLNK